MIMINGSFCLQLVDRGVKNTYLVILEDIKLSGTRNFLKFGSVPWPKTELKAEKIPLLTKLYIFQQLLS